MNSLTFGLRNCLTEVDASGKLIPERPCERRCEKLTFKIRRGVEFHNGKTLDARDVVDTVNHHREESTSAKSILSGIETIKADGAHTVTVALSGGSADFPFLLGDYHLGICPSNGDGTIDWQSGRHRRLCAGGTRTGGAHTRRHPNYWKPNSAFFDENEMQVADTNARTNALRTGSVDCMNAQPLKAHQRHDGQNHHRQQTSQCTPTKRRLTLNVRLATANNGGKFNTFGASAPPTSTAPPRFDIRSKANFI